MVLSLSFACSFWCWLVGWLVGGGWLGGGWLGGVVGWGGGRAL